MHFPRIALLLAGALAATSAAAQPLTCPPADGPCEAFHFHVQMFHPATRGFAEVYAGPAFATEEACTRTRAARVAANQKVSGYFRDVKKQERYLPDRFGSCHCDMTTEKASPTYLGDAQRRMQLRLAEEIRLLVKERLLDEKVPDDSGLIRALYEDLPSTPALAGPKLVALPPAGPSPVTTAADDLQATATIDTSRPSVAALDLPLVDIGTPADLPGTATAPIEPPAGAPPPEPVAAAEPPVEETRVEELPSQEPAPDEPPGPESVETDEGEEQESAEEVAERFISYETQRIQNILRASSVITDEEVKTRIFEACMERIQLLSNLRLLIEGSGMRSPLTAAARNAETEDDRLAFVARVFGENIRPHWAPADAADVFFEADAEVAAEPERALRDRSGRTTDQQKKQALYLVLARSQPTEDQRLWLTSVMENFLR